MLRHFTTAALMATSPGAISAWIEKTRAFQSIRVRLKDMLERLDRISIEE
jgi:hypothetical protein